MNKDFRLAELEGQADALDAIRRLEEQLTEQCGSEVALVAYSAEKEEN